MIIDYKNLISQYDENLLSKLRGFGEEEFLKFWVPDSEKLKSIYIPPSNFLVTPFIAFSKKSPDFKINKREVAELIIVKLDDLILLNKVHKRVTNSYLNNVKVPGYKINKNFIWGATAMILKEFKHILILSED